MTTSVLDRAVRRSRFKQRPAAIDWRNPITRGLLEAYSFDRGDGHPLVSAADALTVTGNAKQGYGEAGLGLDCPNSGTATGAILTLPARLKVNAVTVFWYGIIRSAGTLTDYPTIFGATYDNIDGSPFAAWDLLRDGSSADTLRWHTNSAGVFVSQATNVTLSNFYRKPISMAMTVDSAAVRCFFNGQQQGSDAAGISTINYSASAALCVNRYVVSATDSCDTVNFLGLVFGRALTVSEIRRLHVDPFQVLRDQRLPMVFPASTPGSSPVAVFMNHLRQQGIA